MERTAKLTFLFATVYFVQGIGSPSSGPALPRSRFEVPLCYQKQEKGAETMQYEQRPRIGIFVGAAAQSRLFSGKRA